MAKTTVTNITDDIKVLFDYNITDSDLDTLVLKAINQTCRRMQQWFVDTEIYDEIGASTTLNCVAATPYIDITTVTDLDFILTLSSRVTDALIDIVPYSVFVGKYPDPTGTTAATPLAAARFGNRLYLGPTPTGTEVLYMDYIKLLTALTSSSSLPFENKYDPVVIAGAIEYLTRWQDGKDAVAITKAQEKTIEVATDLILNATRNIGTQIPLSKRLKRYENINYGKLNKG